MYNARRSFSTYVLVAVIGIALMEVMAFAPIAGASDPNPGPTGLYLDIQPDITPVVTPRQSPIVWGAAPPIDPHYGGTLYAGTSAAIQDPRPALDAQNDEPLRMWMADPNDGRTNRPAILWVHGGGFAKGVDAMYQLAATTGADYASRGYVSFSVEYRLNTTTMGQNVQALCTWVASNINFSDPVWRQRNEQCQKNIATAQFDVQGALRWVRAHASEYDIDPDKIALGGFSAGAITVANVAYLGNNVGDVTYWPGDSRSPSASRPQAVFGASGCVYTSGLAGHEQITSGDVPTSFIASQFDPVVPYVCTTATVATARQQGLVSELRSYCAEGGHAQSLYDAHKVEVDRLWTTFLARELNLSSDMAPPTIEPYCSPPLLGSPDGQYVAHSYHDLLGRTPTDQEVFAGISVVDKEGRASFEHDLVYSQQWATHMVHDLYVSVLGREPDAAGLSFWVAKVMNGMGVRDVAIAMYGSPEYYRAQGNTDATYVTALYHAIMGRSPDQSGVNYWTPLVVRRGTSWVAAAFYQSLESRNIRVTSQYLGLLGRDADPSGLAFWSDRLVNEDDLALSLYLVTSNEYYNKD